MQGQFGALKCLGFGTCTVKIKLRLCHFIEIFWACS